MAQHPHPPHPHPPTPHPHPPTPHPHPPTPPPHPPTPPPPPPTPPPRPCCSHSGADRKKEAMRSTGEAASAMPLKRQARPGKAWGNSSAACPGMDGPLLDRKSTRLNSSHLVISY